MLISSPDSKEINDFNTHVQIVNTMNDGVDKRVYINYESDSSQYTAFHTVSESFYIPATSNAYVAVENRKGNLYEFTLIDGDTIDFREGHAYIIVIYEDSRDENEPNITIIDMTP